MKEFDLISSFFTEQAVNRKDVVKGIGDDAAILSVQEGKQLAVTTDTLVEGVHFPSDTPPRAIGHKAVAVNLSDLAAMGAEPSWISLALTLPEVDENWLKEFSQGLFELCEFYNVQLIGGDVTKGPLSITITAQGVLPEGKKLGRDGANAGDLVYVTGNLAEPALALDVILNDKRLPARDFDKILPSLNFPKPRVLAGQVLRDYASAAIDISDGLVSDLNHICQQSDIGAVITAEELPISSSVLESVSSREALEYALNGGDEYELLFTVSPDKKGGMETAMAQTGVQFTCIGQIRPNGGVKVTLDKEDYPISESGYIHFA